MSACVSRVSSAIACSLYLQMWLTLQWLTIVSDSPVIALVCTSRKVRDNAGAMMKSSSLTSVAVVPGETGS